jgi:hypothetical protein
MSEGRTLADGSEAFPASQGMGHVVLGVEARLTDQPDAPRLVELWGRTNAPRNAGVFTGACCGEAMIGYVRQ